MSDSKKDHSSKTSKPDTSGALDMVGTFTVVEAISVIEIGAFMKWGFKKDLFVPLSEQHQPIEVGELYVVCIYLDERTDRIAASTKLDKYLDKSPAKFVENERVQLIVCDRTDLGYKVIINNSHWGLLYKEEVFQVLHYGQNIEGFIKKLRHDGKIDVGLQKGGYQDINYLADKIVAHLKTSQAFQLSDKTAPETIYQLFGISKKQFKMAVGHLYKNKMVVIDDHGIRLSKSH